MRAIDIMHKRRRAAAFHPQYRRRSIFAAVTAGLFAIAAPAHATSPLYWPGSSEPGLYTSSIPDIPPERRRVRLPAMPKADRQAEKLAAEGQKPQTPLLITISIAQQSMKVYDANGLFAETPISSGMRGHSTPMGVYSVIQKNKWHRSNLYSNAPMPYMQRLTWSGVAIHAGVLPGYPASHGCIRMPIAFAVKMWHWTRMGARVVVTPGEITPLPIEHALLVSLKAPVAAAVAISAPPSSAKVETASVAGTRTADASGGGPMVVATVTDAPAITTPAATGVVKRNGAVHLFVSRKDGKLYVRQNFAPLLELPVAIVDADKPLGTHVFTARREASEAKPVHWSVLTLPASAKLPEPNPLDRTAKKRKIPVAEVVIVSPPPLTTPGDALDRIKLADGDLKRLTDMLGDSLITGSSLILSDQGLAAGETGEGTDFIVRLR